MRIDFKTFLQEAAAAAAKPNKINDVSDSFLDGHEAVATTAKHIESLHKHLLGKKSGIEFHTHYTGTPIEFGHDRKGKFYVAQQGDKPNYYLSDILKNHKNDPETYERLSKALTDLPKILPRNGSAYAGNIIHTSSNRIVKDGHVHVGTGENTYSTHADSPEGKKIKASNIGITIHTNVAKGRPVSGKDLEELKQHPDVHVLDSRIRPNTKHYPVEKQKEFLHHFNLATDAYKGMHENIFDDLASQTKHIRNYIQEAKARGAEPKHEDYVEYSKNVSPNHLEQAVNMKHHLKKVFQMHNNLEKAKNVLMDVAHKSEPYIHARDGETKDPKRIISVDKQGMMNKFERNEPEQKQMKEETTTSATGGLGFNTGNPAISPEHLANYVAQNTSDSDTKDNILHDHIKRHTKDYNRIGFKSFLQAKARK